ncbi:MAG: hypothetical protein KJO80_09300, partial [Gammaproteobacteria bacterium]|nr:hypothetical protein [Gammaproteobacteria bacterium]
MKFAAQTCQLSTLLFTAFLLGMPVTGQAQTQLGADIEGEVSQLSSTYAVSLSAEGNHLAIGAHNHDGSGSRSGNVRVFQWSGLGWEQAGASINGEAVEDYSGGSVSISSDGSRVAIGADGNDGNGNYSGHVRVYHWANASWTQLGTDINGEAAEDRSGQSVSL